MEEKTVILKNLEILDKLNINYIVKADHAFLDIKTKNVETGEDLSDFNSLSIELTGQYAGSWKRWSDASASGRSTDTLLQYLVKQKVLLLDDVKPFLSNSTEYENIKGKEVVIKDIEPYDFSNMVINPYPFKAENYLVNVRKIAQPIVKKLISENLIVQDGRGYLRYMWLNNENKFTGADVQGTNYNYERYGKRGTLKLVLPGSKGFFHIETTLAKSISDVTKVIIFEAPADLISYLEIKARLLKDQKAMLISMSGSATKIESTFSYLKEEFDIDINNIEVVIATDNDEAGDEAFKEANSLLSSTTKAIRELPNDGEKILVDGIATTVKDWNDYLKYQKSI